MTQEPLFDQERFMQSLAGDAELARDLLDAFLEDSPERVQSLSQALDEGDAATVSKYAHSLKGMCGVVRSPALVVLALNMENASKKGDVDKAAEIFPSFSSMMEDVHKLMVSFKGTL